MTATTAPKRASYGAIDADEETFELWQELGQEVLLDAKVIELFEHSNCVGVMPITTGVPKAIVTSWLAITKRLFHDQIVLCGHHTGYGGPPTGPPTYVYAAAPGSGWCQRCTSRALMLIHEDRKRKRLPYSMCDGCHANLTVEISLRHYSVLGPYIISFRLCGNCAYGWDDENVESDKSALGEGPPR